MIAALLRGTDGRLAHGMGAEALPACRITAYQTTQPNDPLRSLLPALGSDRRRWCSGDGQRPAGIRADQGPPDRPVCDS